MEDRERPGLRLGPLLSGVAGAGRVFGAGGCGCGGAGRCHLPAKEIGDIHERGEEGLDTWIDQYNNQVARNTALQCLLDGCSYEELLRRRLEALDDGRFIKSPCDTRVPPSIRPDSCPDDGEPAPIGDANSDGMINLDDLLVTVEELGQAFQTADLNTNGVVNLLDIVDLVLIIEDSQ
ncbi:MAG: hypothetical protein HND58_01470 [Planctomycetota bacterium]|nr:MAG: hypothetical protein HND58_01470 [Planctomycetota bacterium]